MKKERKRRQGVSRILKNNLYMLRCAVKYAPSYLVGSIVEGVVWGMIHSCTSVIFVKMLFDRIGEGSFEGSALVIGLMAFFSLSTMVFHHWYWSIFRPKIRVILQQRMHEALFEKARALDLACYDDPPFYNDYVFAIRSGDGTAAGILFNLGKLINRVIATFTILGVLLTIDVSIVLAILLFALISAAIGRLRQKLELLCGNTQDKERHTANPYERGSLSGVKACDEKPKQCSTVQR